MNEALILDTSLFVNPDSAQNFGSNPTEAFTRFLEIAKNARGVECFMPPSIYYELMHFAEEPKIPKELLLAVQQKAPKKHELAVPGFFIYSLVESFRDRVDRGLRLAERHVREAFEKPRSEEDSKNKVRADAESVSRLREQFRRMMREGMLDSKADVDLLLLAYELKGTLVSADMGVLTWAENLGIKILPHANLPVFLREKSSERIPS